MVENLGAVLREQQAGAARKKQYLLDREEQKRLAQLVEREAAAHKYLDDLRAKIPADVKKGHNYWSEDDDGIRYILTPQEGSFVCTDDWGSVTHFYSKDLWNDFKGWLKERGLEAKLEEEAHSEYRGDEGWREHDYYYILIQALDEEV